MRPDPLKDLLLFDPLAAAEKITGASIHDNEGLNATLRSRGDTTFSNKLSRYQDIIEAAGFEKVFETSFQVYPEYTDCYFIYARRDGLLLSFDTYAEKSVNGGKVYYNWKPSKEAVVCYHHYTSSGGFHRADRSGPIDENDVWRGDHDCREALIYNLDRLAANGEFVTPWVERPFLWLLHYGDSKKEGYDYEAINSERIAALPAWVREFLLAS